MPTSRSRKTRIVLISGAGSGIGAALALRFAQEGYTVVGTGRNGARLSAVGEKIHRENGVFISIRCDVRSEAGKRAVERTLSEVGPADVLVNNAGVTYFKDFASTTIKEFDYLMETNLRGMFLMTKAVLPSMLKRRRGLVINILSYAARTVYTGSSIYSASKSAGAAMMGVLREEVRGKGIKVLNIYPGAIETPMWSARNRSRYGSRMMQPHEIAEFIVAAAALPASIMLEEIALRPQQGDLKL